MYHVHMANTKSTPQASSRPVTRALNAQVTSKTSTKTTSQLASKAKVFQVLVRLPEDMATRFVQVVKPGQRNSYFLELLRRDLDRESDELAQAAQALTKLEAKDSALHKEDAAWLNASLISSDDDFDAQEFERQYQIAKQEREAANKTTEPSAFKRTANKASATRARKSLQAA
jgi:hypothetical protein